MKNIKYSIIGCLGFAMLTMAAASCKKSFLEITPKGKLIAKNTSDYDKALYSLDVLNIETEAQMMMGDEVAAVDPFFSGSLLRTQRLFRWESEIYLPAENPKEMAMPMQNIYLYNKVINEVMESEGGTDAEKRSIVAQAKVGRAFTYFLLINYYGKPYLAATAATDAGFPIIKAADVTQNSFTRASVQEVYDFIIEDLTTSIPDLPAQITHRLRVSKAAATGILGKVYLFMGRPVDALPAFNEAFTNMANATVPIGLYDYNVRFGSGGSFLPVGMFGPTYPTSINIEENILTKQVNAYPWGLANNEIVLSEATLKLYEADDLRRNFFTSDAFPSGTLPNGLKRRRGPNSAQIGFTVPDLYLLRAETKARLDDLDGARTDLEVFRGKRMPAVSKAIPDAVATDKKALIRFILEERIREFAVLGYRWFDMRRLSVDPDFSNTVGTTHILYDAQGEASSTYTLKPERLVLRFAQKTMDLNPGMNNNP